MKKRVIKIKDKNLQELLKGLNNERLAYENGMNVMAIALRRKQDKFWEIVYREYPEIKEYPSDKITYHPNINTIEYFYFKLKDSFKNINKRLDKLDKKKEKK